MVLHEVDVSEPLFTLCIKLQHLNKTLTCLFNQTSIKLQIQQLNAWLKIIENLVDMKNNLILMLTLN